MALSPGALLLHPGPWLHPGPAGRKVPGGRRQVRRDGLQAGREWARGHGGPQGATVQPGRPGAAPGAAPAAALHRTMECDVHSEISLAAGGREDDDEEEQNMVLTQGLLSDEAEDSGAALVGTDSDSEATMGMPLSLLGGHTTLLSSDLDARSLLVLDADGNATEVPLESLLLTTEEERDDAEEVQVNEGEDDFGAGAEAINGVQAEDEEVGVFGASDPGLKRLLLEENGRTLLVRLGADGQLHLDSPHQLEEARELGLVDGLDEVEGESQGFEGLEGFGEEHEEKPKVVPVNKNWFTSREDKSTLASRGHCWRQGMWSREETELLQQNIRAYCLARGIPHASTVVFGMAKDERKDFYRVVAEGINRPLFSVYRRVIRLYDNKNHLGRYNQEELQQLRMLRARHGNDWQKIASALGRSAASIRDRCRLLKDNCNTGKWCPEEEDRLAQAVYELTEALPGEAVTAGISWAAVAAKVATRTEKQCRTKWLNYLGWKQAGGSEWTREDDRKLVTKLMCLNVTDENEIDWAALANGWSAARSPQWLRGKWWSLKRQLHRSSSSPSSSASSLGSPASPSPTPHLKELCQQLCLQTPEALGLAPVPRGGGAASVANRLMSSGVAGMMSQPMVVDAGVQTQFDLTTAMAVNPLGLMTASPVLIDTSQGMVNESGGVVVGAGQGQLQPATASGMEMMAPGLLGGAPTILISCPNILPAPSGLTFIQTVNGDSVSPENMTLQLNPANHLVVTSMAEAESGSMLPGNAVDIPEDLSQKTELPASDDELQEDEEEDDVLCVGVGVGTQDEQEDETEIGADLILNDPMLAHSSSLIGLEDNEKCDEDDDVEEESSSE